MLDWETTPGPGGCGLGSEPNQSGPSRVTETGGPLAKPSSTSNVPPPLLILVDQADSIVCPELDPWKHGRLRAGLIGVGKPCRRRAERVLTAIDRVAVTEMDDVEFGVIADNGISDPAHGRVKSRRPFDS